MNNGLRLAICIIGCEAVGWVSSVFTLSAIPIWYAFLEKPQFAPPNWVFGPVWTALYAMMGIALYIVWSKRIDKSANRDALMYFFIQLALNFFWSLIFFGLRSPLFAFIEIIVLLIMILMTIWKFHPISKTAAYLLIPYAVWVAFASLLNFSIILLN